MIEIGSSFNPFILPNHSKLRENADAWQKNGHTVRANKIVDLKFSILDWFLLIIGHYFFGAYFVFERHSFQRLLMKRVGNEQQRPFYTDR